MRSLTDGDIDDKLNKTKDLDSCREREAMYQNLRGISSHSRASDSVERESCTTHHSLRGERQDGAMFDGEVVGNSVLIDLTKEVHSRIVETQEHLYVYPSSNLHTPLGNLPPTPSRRHQTVSQNFNSYPAYASYMLVATRCIMDM